ncbi:MAG: ABC-2 family transporter protein [bacterium]|nr:ABC-2 family transporter protein [bacterium]
MRMIEYRGDFIFWAVVSILWTGFNFFFFSLILRVSNTIAGWSTDEMYLLLGVFTVLDALTWTFFHRNMHEYTQHIFTGSLTTLLTKPINTIFLLTMGTNNYNNVFRFLIGCVVIVISVQRVGASPSIIEVALFLLALLAAALLIYAIWFICSTTAFWIEKLDNINEVVPGLRRVMQVPRGVFAGATSILFTIILPFSLVASVPSEILLQRAEPKWVVWLFVSSLLSLILAHTFFYFALKRYSSVGN